MSSGLDSERPVAADRPLRDPELEPPSPLGRWRARTEEMRRADVYTRPVIDGRELRRGSLKHIAARLSSLTVSRLEKEEADLEQRLRGPQQLTRTNTVAVISPKGGVGKTTCTFLVANLLASHLKLRVLAVDANVDFGTLAALAPDDLRVDLSLAELLGNLDRVDSAAELRPYVSRLPTGLHVLGAPPDAEVMARITPADYGDLLAFAGRWYEAIILDLGTGIAGEFAQFALHRADQTVIVTTPEWITATNVAGALKHLRRERATLVMNQALGKNSGDHQAIEAHFRKQSLSRRVTIPYDVQLRTMLDSGTYSLEGLRRDTRVPVKRLGLAVAQHLV
jgi:MinD-like ATPase involved in chromosome partitioning or flagellar assembly